MTDSEFQNLIQQAFDILDKAVRGAADEMEVPVPAVLLDVKILTTADIQRHPRARLLAARMDWNLRVASARHMAIRTNSN